MLADTDIAVIGGGVVGCAVARRMTLDGAKVILLEKGSDILEGASKGNSAILHTGFDAPSETLEHQCVTLGYREYLEIHKELNLPLKETGALLTAWTEEEEEKFSKIVDKAKKNGIETLKILSSREVYSMEPHLGDGVKAAIHVPGEFIIDPWSTPLAYLKHSVENGGQVLYNTEVTGGSFQGEHWLLETPKGTVKTKYTINCAGLYGDTLDLAARGESKFTIKPRKGQFVVFDKTASPLLKSIILPVPTERTKGIVLFPTIFGNIVVGPTAEEQESRNDSSVDKGILTSLIEQAHQKLPGLKAAQTTATYAGIRPATEKPHYRITNDKERNWITLGGIRSTGLTSALGLARHASNLLSEMGAQLTPISNPKKATTPNLAEHLPRDYNDPGYGEMICHCEMVTRREIEAAMTGPVPAGNLGGLKRRTRAGMGRCQGFYCSGHLAEITKGKLNNHPAKTGDKDE